jgi:hypothetical protein
MRTARNFVWFDLGVAIAIILILSGCATTYSPEDRQRNFENTSDTIRLMQQQMLINRPYTLSPPQAPMRQPMICNTYGRQTICQ